MSSMQQNPFAPPEDNPFQAQGDQSTLLPPDDSAKSDDPVSMAKDNVPLDTEPVRSQVQPDAAAPAWAQPRDGDAMRSQDLDAREQDIIRREQALERKLDGLELKNYPKCYPLVYNDIGNDIPPAYKGLATVGFFYVHIHIMALAFNWVCIFADFSLTCFFIGLIYVLVGMWVCWNLQYRRLYKALSKSSDVRVFVFLFNFFISVCFDIVMAIGIPQTCGIGLWGALDKLNDSDHQAVGFMFLVSFTLWSMNALVGMYIFRRTLRVWKEFGGSTDKMRKEAEKEAGRQAVKAAAAQYT